MVVYTTFMKLILFALLAVPALFAQAPATVANQVLAILTVKPDVARADMMKVMPQEVRDTVKLYLDGKIQQWYSRGDGKGVVFIMNCKDAAEASAIMDQMPLSKGKFADYQFIPLAPLNPLRNLLQ
jgi:hypothetical protein